MVKDGGGRKLGDAGKVLVLQIVRGVQTAAGQKGVLDAGGQSSVIAYLQIEIIQFLQQTVSHIIGKISQVVAVYFIHRTAGLLHELIADICFISGAVLPCQRFRNNSVMFFLHLPQIGGF